jgi:DHA1 family multidrug resistance protein-like MFS transporter
MMIAPVHAKEKTILLTGVFLVMTGLSMTLPVLPFYIERLLSTEGISLGRVSLHVGLITGSFPLTQFLFSTYLGSLSDKFGRRPLILSGIAGFSVATFIFSLGGSITLLYTSRLIAGIFTAGFVTASGAYIADKTPKEKRGKNMAVLSSVAGLGAVAGPFLGNMLSKVDLQRWVPFGQSVPGKFASPFVISSGLTLIVFVLYLILLPESLQLDENKRIQISEVKLKTSFLPNWRKVSNIFLLLLFLSFISQLALAMFEGTFALHSQRLFAFGPRQMSLVFMLCGSLMGLLQLGPVAWLIQKQGEYNLLPFGLVVLGIGIFMLTTTRQMEWIFVYVAFISVGMAILTPSLASLITKESTQKIGASLGIFSAVNSLGQVIGVVIGGVIMIWSDHLAYWVIALLLLITAYVLWRERIIKKTIIK